MLITTMAGNIKNLIMNLLCWLPKINWPSFKTPSQKGNKPTKALQIFHRSRIKSPDAPCKGQSHVLDFISKADLDVYNEGRTPVLEGDNCFDLKPETLGQFLKMLDKKATDQGWNDASSTQQIGIFNITHDGDPTMISITKDHQYIETSVLRAQCERFMNGKGSQNQASQNNQMMQECIWGSLTLGAKQRIGRFKDEYTLNNLCCGPILLNIIKRTVSKNSRRRTIVAIRSRLDHIDAYVDEMNGNVKLVTVSSQSIWDSSNLMVLFYTTQWRFCLKGFSPYHVKSSTITLWTWRTCTMLRV